MYFQSSLKATIEKIFTKEINSGTQTKCLKSVIIRYRVLPFQKQQQELPPLNFELSLVSCILKKAVTTQQVRIYLRKQSHSLLIYMHEYHAIWIEVKNKGY